MKKLYIVLVSAMLVTFGLAQQGPVKESGETVARPRKKGADPAEAEAPKIPSKFSKKDGSIPGDGTATFRSDVSTVSVDVAVMETGLGGRLDAVTALPAVATAITSIGADHLEILGPTLLDVAREKAVFYAELTQLYAPTAGVIELLSVPGLRP